MSSFFGNLYSFCSIPDLIEAKTFFIHVEPLMPVHKLKGELTVSLTVLVTKVDPTLNSDTFHRKPSMKLSC